MSFHIQIEWASGAFGEYSGEVSKEQFLTSFFGHHERLPDGVVVTDLQPKDLEKVEEIKDAVEIRKVEASDLPKHSDGDSSRKAQGPSSSNSDVKSGTVEKQKQKGDEK